MLRFTFSFLLAVLSLNGCSDEANNSGGSGGTGGAGSGGGGGIGGADSAVWPCTEQGIRDAITVGGGPNTFLCNGPTTVVTVAEIVIDNDVILDGEGNLTVDGNEAHRVFSVSETGTAELRGFTITKGLVLGDVGFGGGILNEGTLTLTNSTVSSNIAASGGGIFNRGTLTVATTTVSFNGTTGSGTSGATGGGIFNWGTLTLTPSRVWGNNGVYGGGIFNWGTLALTNSTVRGNSGFYGAGIQNGGTLTLTNSTVYENSGSYGGGILNAEMLTVIDSTVSGNTAVYEGGGIKNEGTLTLTNSTVSRNLAVEAGGGIDNMIRATLIASTVSGNSATQGGGIENTGTLTLTNSLVDGECEISPHPSVTVTSNGYNIESPGDTCGFDQPTDQANVTAADLSLSPLADNGGPTETHALLPGSAAIDLIPEVDCVDAGGEPLTTDQRGEPRPDAGGTMCDVGAFEVQQ
jgi:hypothetical protein